MAQHESNKESEILSSYSLSLKNLPLLTLMNKTLLEVALDILDPKLFSKILCYDTKLFTTLQHPL